MKDRAAIPALLNDLGLVGESVEVGVRKGEYSKHILENWKGQKHHMVDPWEHQDEKIYKDISNRDDKWQNELYTNLAKHMASKHPGRHQLHRGYSVQVAVDFQDDSLDFVYLDARHDYAGLKEDIEAWWPKLKLGRHWERTQSPAVAARRRQHRHGHWYAAIGRGCRQHEGNPAWGGVHECHRPGGAPGAWGPPQQPLLGLQRRGEHRGGEHGRKGEDRPLPCPGTVR